LIARLHSLRRQEDGQALIFCVLMLALLLGIASLVVDGGNALLQRRNQQGVADAAAMAAIKDLPASPSAADSAARAYATTQNSADQSIVDQVVVTGTSSGSCDGGFGSKTLAPESVCVVVHTNTKGFFSGLLGLDIWKEDARAIAQASQVTAVGAWLPFGVRLGAFTDDPPTQVSITPADQSRNVGGAVNTPAGPDCKFYGGNQISDVIKGALYGGEDACPISVGQTIQTQTGVSTGNITTKGFDVRIGSNTDSFSDVFGQDADGNYYVKKTNSPRLGIIPVAQDTSGSWPLSGNATMTMQGYVLVYIGDTSSPPDYPAYSGGGSRLTIYFTPVDAPLPDSWAALLGDYSASNPSPVVYRLVS
jgi:putative Flp pilus-assembly TadE/G-like protein